jgi:hypothetical protein
VILEKVIEEKVVSLLRERIDNPAVVVCGAWDVAIAGEVKGEEQAGEAARLLVAASAPAFDTYESGVAEVAVSFALVVRKEASPNGALLVELLDAVEQLRLPFQFDRAHLATLETPAFAVCGARVDAGDPPAYHAAANAWTVARSLVLKGVIAYQI